MKKLLIIISIAVCVITGRAEDIVRPVLSSWMLTTGPAHRADTYLSPLHYRGWNIGVGYERFQATGFAPDRWVRALDIDVNVDRRLNPVRNSELWGAGLSGRWALMRRYSIRPDVDLGIGGATSLDVGALYMSRNGNNPVAANASWTIDLSAYAVWRFNIGRLPVVALYRATLPVVGAFFSPDYGQLYYEIYLGDSGGVVRPAYWGSYFSLDQRLTVDLRLGSTSLRLGYGVNIRSTKADDIISRRINHVAVIGVAGEWMSLSPGNKLDPEVRVISAIY